MTLFSEEPLCQCFSDFELQHKYFPPPFYSSVPVAQTSVTVTPPDYVPEQTNKNKSMIHCGGLAATERCLEGALLQNEFKFNRMAGMETTQWLH